MVTSYAEKFYPDGGPLQQIKLTVGVEGSTPPDEQKGALKAVSPQEELIAPLWALGTSLQEGKVTDSDAEMWTNAFTTTLVTFKMLKTEEAREFETIMMRQAIHHQFQAIVYTPVQWVCKIMQMKQVCRNNTTKRTKKTHEQDRNGKASASDIAQLFKQHNFKAARGQEEISTTFVTNACYIWDHALCYKEVHDVLIRGAERFSHNSMFDSLNKIAEIIRKCKMDGVKLKWVFGLMLDRVQEGYMSVGDCSHSNLFGNTSKKGELDVLIALLELKDHLLYEYVPGLGLDASVTKAFLFFVFVNMLC